VLFMYMSINIYARVYIGLPSSVKAFFGYSNLKVAMKLHG